jgi:carboxyl-terminal processing protease
MHRRREINARRLTILIVGGALLIVGTIILKAAIALGNRRYLEVALDVMQAHAAWRHDVDWETLRARAYTRNRIADTRSQTYDVIRFVLASLGDHHSGFISPEMVSRLNALTVTDNPAPESRVLSDRLGYIRVPPFVSGRQGAIDEAATRLQRAVEEADAEHPCGWVVDLQTNGGGNMWPMLAGLGPILGTGRLGGFVDPDGVITTWSYADGAAAEANQPRAHVIGGSYRSRASTAAVAVLIGRATASSGEAVAIAFIGRPNTRSFGQRTRGLTTSNDQFRLSDGAILNLSVSAFADRNGGVYPDGIDPDEPTVAVAAEPIPTAARHWLLAQPACQAR